MQAAKPGASNRLVHRRTVRGEPYEVRGRRLIPVARMVSLGRVQATIGTHRLEGWGWGLAYVKPVAMIEEMPGRRRCTQVAIRDATAQALVSMFLAALGITLLFAGVRWLARRHTPSS